MRQMRVGFEEVVVKGNRTVITGLAALTPRTIRGDRVFNLFERVVVPLGLIEDPEPLLNQAAGLAARFHAEILLLQLIPATNKTLHIPVEAAHLRSSLTKTAQGLIRAGAARVYAAMLEGNASHHIEDVARQHQASLIMLAEEPDNSELQPWFGTVTQRLSRRAHVPLLVMKPNAPLTMAPVFCVVDFSDSAREALTHSANIARELRTKLTVFHVVPEPKPPWAEGPIWAGEPHRAHAQDGMYTPVQQAEIERKTDSARDELKRFIADYDMSDLDVELAVTCGPAVSETITAARDRKAGLIVMGSGARCGLSMIETQTPAEAVAEITDIPILIAHPAAQTVSSSDRTTPFAHKTR
jgi:nucleotide-binding universal stress UspA family protein